MRIFNKIDVLIVNAFRKVLEGETESRAQRQWFWTVGERCELSHSLDRALKHFVQPEHKMCIFSEIPKWLCLQNFILVLKTHRYGEYLRNGNQHKTCTGDRR